MSQEIIRCPYCVQFLIDSDKAHLAQVGQMRSLHPAGIYSAPRTGGTLITFARQSLSPTQARGCSCLFRQT